MHLLAKIGISTAAAAAAIAIGGWCAYPRVESDDVGQAMAHEMNQQSHAAKGFGADQSRVDSQITLAIPTREEADAVYAYLRDTYTNRKDLLKDRFPDLNLTGKKMSDRSDFTDAYFDTPSLDLYRHKNSCRYRIRENTTNPEDRKNGRQLVQMKVTPPGNFQLRNELKYEVKPSKRPKTEDDVHPLLRLIDKKLRPGFKEVYANAGLDAHALRHVFTIKQLRRRGYIDLDGVNIFSFSVDTGTVEKNRGFLWSTGTGILWTRGSFASVDMGLVEIEYTQADEARRKLMWSIRDAIIDDLKQHFPDLTVNSDSKYTIVLNQLMQQCPLIPLLLRFQLL
jgi:hypothetical protein